MSRVLIVDDDPVVRDLLSRFLRSHNFDTAVLHDGVHLQRRLERERPSIVVLDIMMPETDGLEAIAALRAAGDDIPVIFVTARGAVSDRIRPSPSIRTNCSCASRTSCAGAARPPPAHRRHAGATGSATSNSTSRCARSPAATRKSR